MTQIRKAELETNTGGGSNGEVAVMTWIMVENLPELSLMPKKEKIWMLVP